MRGCSRQGNTLPDGKNSNRMLNNGQSATKLLKKRDHPIFSLQGEGSQTVREGVIFK
jgi:hypothetical protein